MLENLKLGRKYDGFLFLAESIRNPPKLNSHHHVELELNLVVRGSITYIVGERRYTFPQRTLLWLFPSQEHQLVDRSDDAKYYVLVFTPKMIKRSCRSSRYQALRRKRPEGVGVHHAVLKPESFDFICKTMDSLMLGSLAADVLNREAGFGVGSSFSFQHQDPEGLNAGLRYLLLLCWRCQQQGRIHEDVAQLHPSVKKALALLGNEACEDNLAQLAKKCGVSETYLSRVFAQQIGLPINRYRNSLRMGRFWEIFRNADQKHLTEAVYAAGFGSYAQFYKIFVRTYGAGPRSCLAGSG